MPTKHRRAEATALLIIMLSTALLVPSPGQTPGRRAGRAGTRRRPPALFTAPRIRRPPAALLADPVEPQAEGGRVLRSREVELDRNVLNALPRPRRTAVLLSESTPGGTISLDLFDDARYVGVVERAERPSPGSRAWSGNLLGSGGTFTVVVDAAGLTGNVRAPDGYYEIKSRGGTHVVEQIDTDRLKKCAVNIPEETSVSAETLNATPTPTPTPAASPTPTPDDGSVIDVLVLYTAAARDAAARDAGERSGTDAAILRLIDTCQAESDTVYSNSRIPTRLNIVHRELVSYTGDANGRELLSTILGQLTVPFDGELDDIHALRDARRADVVLLIVRDDDEGGLANFMGARDFGAGFERLAFAVSSHDAVSGNLLFQHEIGHIQGLDHDRDNTRTRGLYCYSHGLRFRLGRWQYRTVMAYSPGILIPYFSDPSVEYSITENGQTLTAALAEPDPDKPTHEALSVSNTRRLVANFRNRNAP